MLQIIQDVNRRVCRKVRIWRIENRSQWVVPGLMIDILLVFPSCISLGPWKNIRARQKSVSCYSPKTHSAGKNVMVCVQCVFVLQTPSTDKPDKIALLFVCKHRDRRSSRRGIFQFDSTPAVLSLWYDSQTIRLCRHTRNVWAYDSTH